MQYNLDSNPKAQKAPKEMLSATISDSKQLVVKINNSSLDLIMTCPRKAYYMLKRNLISNEENAAMLFGTSIHKALETWYSLPKAQRNTPAGREAATGSFLLTAKPLETSTDALDKRGPANGIKILNNYFDKYANDPYEILLDAKGAPYVERRFEFVLHETPIIKVIVFGTVDAVLFDPATQTTLICDHKTTSALGIDFYNRLKPNFQYTAYVMGAQRAWGLKTNMFLVNGIQVAKTKWDLARQVTTRDENDFKEFKYSMLYAVRQYLEMGVDGVWPQNAPNPCTQYGGCAFRDVCAAPESVRETMIEGLFKNRGIQ